MNFNLNACQHFSRTKKINMGEYHWNGKQKIQIIAQNEKLLKTKETSEFTHFRQHSIELMENHPSNHRTTYAVQHCVGVWNLQRSIDHIKPLKKMWNCIWFFYFVDASQRSQTNHFQEYTYFNCSSIKIATAKTKKNDVEILYICEIKTTGTTDRFSILHNTLYIFSTHYKYFQFININKRWYCWWFSECVCHKEKKIRKSHKWCINMILHRVWVKLNDWASPNSISRYKQYRIMCPHVMALHCIKVLWASFKKNTIWSHYM